MSDFFEVDDKKKTIKTLNLDDLSIPELNQYIQELKNEIDRVKSELIKKSSVKKDAEKFFK